MKILLLGSGGREHAFAKKISESKKCTALFIAPGNAGTELCGTNVNIDLLDFSSLRRFVVDEKIELLVVGPEEPLVKGLRDFFEKDPDLKDLVIVGPGSNGAQLEGSKDFAKQFMMRHSIPTAAYKTFTRETYDAAIDFLKTLKPPFVLKADGLAAGKGVVIPDTLEGAEEVLKDMLMNERFGASGARVVIEEFLKGIELSVFVLCDGNSYCILPEAKDYKRIQDGDQGPNTGGMGAVSPVPFADVEFMKKVEQRIVIPSVEGLKNDKIDYRGFLFIGLMNVGGDPYVIEYNVRMGDPETEAVLPRIKNDFADLLMAAGTGKLDKVKLETDPSTSLTVVMVSGGYPEKYSKGYEISGLEDVHESIVFHAGTGKKDGNIMTAGGRVLAITSLAKDIQKAREKSYRSIGMISFKDRFFRKDIGMDLLK